MVIRQVPRVKAITGLTLEMRQVILETFESCIGNAAYYSGIDRTREGDPRNLILESAKTVQLLRQVLQLEPERPARRGLSGRTRQ
jgi:hypothetical protein